MPSLPVVMPEGLLIKDNLQEEILVLVYAWVSDHQDVVFSERA
jgi:hypothetical protein